MTELPCLTCLIDYGEYQPNWCPLLGKIVISVDDIPLYRARIPELRKNEDCCLGYIPRNR